VSIAGGEIAYRYYARHRNDDGTIQKLGVWHSDVEAQQAIDNYKQYGIIPARKKPGPKKKV